MFAQKCGLENQVRALALCSCAQSRPSVRQERVVHGGHMLMKDKQQGSKRRFPNKQGSIVRDLNYSTFILQVQRSPLTSIVFNRQGERQSRQRLTKERTRADEQIQVAVSQFFLGSFYYRRSHRKNLLHPSRRYRHFLETLSKNLEPCQLSIYINRHITRSTTTAGCRRE